MKSIFIKEIKYVSAYAAVIFLALIAYAAWANRLIVPANATGEWMPSPMPLVILAAPFVALFFGFWQCFSEQAVGKGSFLLQRDLSSTSVFWIKAVAGIGVSALITVVPFVGQEAWRIYSDRFPLPAHWETAVAALCLLLTIPAWMAGSLVAVRPAKWWGSRLFPIVAVLFGIIQWPWAVLVAVIYTVTALGVFVAQGDGRRMKLPAFIGLGIINGIAGIAVLCFALNLLISPFRPYWTSSDWHYSFADRKFFSSDGFNGGNTPWHFQNGPLEYSSQPMTGTEQYIYFGSYTASDSFPLDQHSNYVAPLVRGFRQASFYDPIDGVYKQYDTSSGRLVSIIDRLGFRRPHDRRPLQRFQDAFQTDDHRYIASSDFVGRVNFNDQKVVRVFTSEQGEHILALTCMPGFDPDASSQSTIIVTSRRIIELTSDDKIAYAWTTALPARSISRLSIDKSDAVIWYDDYRTARETAIVLHDGRQVALDAFDETNVEHKRPFSSLFDDLSNGAMPIAVYAGFSLLQHNAASGVNEDPSILSSMIAGAIFFLLLTRALGIRLGWSRQANILWMLISALFGAAGLAAALTLYEWPARLACPSCGRKRLVTKTLCVHCGASWPLPASDDSEIFEADAYAARSVDRSSIDRRTEHMPTGDLSLRGVVSPLQAILFKELRLVAPALFVSLMLGICYLLYTGQLMYSWQNVTWGWPNPDFSNWFYPFSVASAVPIAVGQFYAETRSNASRAFALHRPLTPSIQFLVKLIIGLAGYATAVGLILGAYYWITSAPGVIPGPMAVQGWALGLQDVGLASLFWFGTALALTTQGKWYGRRLIPCIFCLGLGLLGHQIHSAIGYASALTTAFLLLASAAWDGFSGDRPLKRRPLLGRISLAAISIGAVFFSLFAIDTFAGGLNETANSSSAMSNFLSRRDPQESFERVDYSGWTQPNIWFLDRSKGIMLCYGDESRRLIGYVDGNGWKASSQVPQQVDPFDVSSIYNYEDIEVGKVWDPQPHLISVGRHHISQIVRYPPGTRAIFDAEPDERIIGLRQWQGPVVVETSKRFVFLKSVGDPLVITTILKPVQLRGNFGRVTLVYDIKEHTPIKGGGFITEESGQEGTRILDYYRSHHNSFDSKISFTMTADVSQPGKTTLPSYETTAAGNVLRETTVTVTNYRVPPSSLNTLAGMYYPLSLGVDGIYLILNGWDKLGVLELALLPTLVGLLLCAFIGKRLEWSRLTTALWCLASLILGLYAPVAIAALYSFPAREQCQSCGKKRLVTNERCEHCGAEWPSPAATGREIFEPISAPAIESLVGK